MPKIFVLYASAGQGHTKAAQVIHRYLAQHAPDADLRLIDALDYSVPSLKWSYLDGYNFLIRRAQWLWFVIFHGSALRLPFRFTDRLNRFFNHLNSRALYELLARERPDIVICTHFLPSQVAAELKIKGTIQSCLVTVITDFGVHPFWIAEGTDMYSTASSATQRTIERMGVAAGKAIVTGIPVAPGEITGDPSELRKRLGLDPNAFTVLLVTGSFGIGPLERIARLLRKECQVLVVCARNTALFDRLVAARLPNVKVYGFVQNMNELMAASDIIVTKPGGLSISELLVLNAVPVFISAIPGQETENVRTLRQENVGTYCRTPEAVYRTVRAFIQSPEKLRASRAAVSRVRKPNSAEEICNAIRARCSWTAG